MKTITGKGALDITIIDSGQGMVGIVENLPIVVESSNIEQLKTDITTALGACIIENPTMISDMISIEIPA